MADENIKIRVKPSLKISIIFNLYNKMVEYNLEIRLEPRNENQHCQLQT